MKKKNSINHLSIILDGNKRWAKNKDIPIIDAYKAGINNLLKISDIIIENEIKYLSVFTLSTENLNRKSINLIFKSIFDEFSDFIEKIIKKESIKIKVIGEKDNLPQKIQKLIYEAETVTKNNKKLTLVLAFNYGFKMELYNSFKKAYDLITKNDKIKIENINFDELFYLGNIPDPDILIRTGGFQRLSNYLMYNLTYTELFFTKTLWPDFDEIELKEIINKFINIKRNYGI